MIKLNYDTAEARAAAAAFLAALYREGIVFTAVENAGTGRLDVALSGDWLRGECGRLGNMLMQGRVSMAWAEKTLGVSREVIEAALRKYDVEEGL